MLRIVLPLLALALSATTGAHAAPLATGGQPPVMSLSTGLQRVDWDGWRGDEWRRDEWRRRREAEIESRRREEWRRREWLERRGHQYGYGEYRRY